MYEDLTTGGESAQTVLSNLVAGPNGQDEEGDRVHHLLHLLDQPEPSVESGTETPAEVATEDFTAAALVESVEAATQAAPEAVVPEAEREALSEGHAAAHKPSTGMINFLQEDELAANAGESAAGQAEARTPDAAITADEDFEIVPQMAPHEVGQEPLLGWEADNQTSGLQPPVETAATAEAPTSSAVPALSRKPSAFAPVPTGNWADLDDDDEFMGGSGSAAPQMTSSSVPAVHTSESTTTPATAARSTGEESSAAVPATSARPPRGQKGPRRPNQPRQKQQGREPQSQPKQTEQAATGQKMVDDDGFELKSRRAPVTPTRGGARGSGRGGPRGGATSGGRGGRGRGGAANGRVVSGTGEEGQTKARPKQTQRQPSQPKAATEGQEKAKPSIYKAAQPTAPKSAPIN